MRIPWVKSITATVCGFLMQATPASAQTAPWDTFVDAISGSTCDVVNAANAELVVLRATGQLVIVSAEDVTLQDTFVDVNGFVFFEGGDAGLISFDVDGDGLLTLWWTSLTGRVVQVNEFTGEPSVTNQVPGDFTSVPCDACDFWDDRTLCGDTGNGDDPTFPPVTITFCGTGVQAGLALTMLGLLTMRLIGRRRL